jgi:hypothetical protein
MTTTTARLGSLEPAFYGDSRQGRSSSSLSITSVSRILESLVPARYRDSRQGRSSLVWGQS